MALRDKMIDEARPHLQPGENVQAVFAAQAASPFWSLLSYWIIIAKDAYRAVIVTDQRILVFRTSRIRFTSFKAVERELPRLTHLGPPEGKLWYTTSALGEELWIARRFFSDVEAADAALAGA